jgi:SpoVK/Ycf46/Vps4 family AAA+-type ATPase
MLGRRAPSQVDRSNVMWTVMYRLPSSQAIRRRSNRGPKPGKSSGFSFPLDATPLRRPALPAVSRVLTTYHADRLISQMADFERTLLKLIRAGLAGNTQATRKEAAALLRVDTSLILSPETRSSLSDALLSRDAESPQAVSRSQSLTSLHPRPGQVEDVLALTRIESVKDIAAPVLRLPEQQELDAIVAERARVHDLEVVGLMPTRTLLLTGAPGVGKTMTAYFLAGVLRLPLVTIDLAAVVSSYLGRTGQNIRKAMDSARAAPCVMLLDEIDALGKRRDDPSDIGELKRIVNVLLLELEVWPAYGLMVAATNHPELLDRAIWRRFDRVINLSLPDQMGRQVIVARVLEAHGQPAPAELCEQVGLATPGASGAVLTLLVRDAVRQMILERGDGVSEILKTRSLGWLREEARRNPKAKQDFAVVAHQAGMSQRQIASVLEVSHVTVGTLLRERMQKQVMRPAKAVGRTKSDS